MNILIVDDDPDFVTLTKCWLEREGHAVSHAGTGPAALSALAADPLPDLVVLDVLLPRIDGFTLLKRIRADERLRGLPVIIVSSFDRHQDIAHGKELGADDYLVKPLMEYHFLGRVARFAKPPKT
jgi:two-component system cell cycle response regulator